MFGYWLNSRARQPSLFPGATASLIVNVGLLGTWIYATLPSDGVPKDSLGNKTYHAAFYMPPPPKAEGGRASERRDQVTYVGLPLPNADRMGNEAPAPKQQARLKQLAALDSLIKLPTVQHVAINLDSVYTEVDVDTPVRMTASAAPDYPADLLKKNVEGKVVARWIIDTTGHADTASFEVLQTTNPEFGAALRAVLPKMRFAPARIGRTPVRQLVEQAIRFTIQQPPLAASPGKPAP